MVISRFDYKHDHDHDHDEKCVRCSGQMSVEEMKAWENKCMEKYGFFMHFVPLGEYLNAHTHGVFDSFKHPDLQLVLPVSGAVGGSILRTVVNRIKKGETFKPGQDYQEIAQGYPVRFMKAVENGRDVLRLIFPDRDGRFPGDPGVSEMIAGQIDVVT